jgi:predicted flap endonuclease-1-like 5' DNA nuclease
MEEENAMNLPIADLKGMTKELAAKLKAKGIMDSDAYLAAVATPAKRSEFAKAYGVELALVLELANRADLARVKGIGAAYSDMLETAGVDTVKELSKRVPANLHAKLMEAHEAKKAGGPGPSLKGVEDWVAQAKALSKMLEY